MSIGKRLTMVFASLALIIACGAAVLSWEFASILRQTRMLVAVDDKVVALYRVRADVGAIRRRLDRASKTQDVSRFVTIAHLLRRELSDDVDESRRHFRESGTPVPGTLSTLRDTIGDQFDAMQRLIDVNDWTAVRLRLDSQVDGILDSVREMVERVNSDASDQRILYLRDITTSQQRAQIIVGATAFVSLAIALALGLHVRQSIVRPLRQLNVVAHQFAAGDFDVTMEIGSRDELGEVSHAFVVAAGKLRDYYSELERSNEALEQFAYAASHDLQEPLRTIASFSELLKRRHSDTLSQQAKQYLSHVTDASAHMQELVGGILEYSRLTTCAGLQEDVVETEEIIGIILENLRATIEQTRAVVTHDLLPGVTGSKLQLIQLFQNLVGNAIKYRREGELPRIHISAKEQGAMWLFCVEDNGIGIDTKYHAQVFGMFKQLNRAPKGGVGLGLAISKQIVERHGGTISVVSAVGQGSRFYFTLKRSDGTRTPSTTRGQASGDYVKTESQSISS